MVTIEKSRLPKGVRPGNILKIEKDGTIRLDAEEELPQGDDFQDAGEPI